MSLNKASKRPRTAEPDQPPGYDQLLVDQTEPEQPEGRDQLLLTSQTLQDRLGYNLFSLEHTTSTSKDEPKQSLQAPSHR
jgi:hypothetical protein